MTVLDSEPLVALRRNHALEHATINVLSERFPAIRLVGRSDWSGFTLYGAVGTEDVADASLEAMRRLKAGESQLAIHPRCGTNLATGVLLMAVASTAVLSGQRRSRLARILGVMWAMAFSLSLAQPLGEKVQEHVTTSSDVADLRVTEIRRNEMGSFVVHRIATAQA